MDQVNKLLANKKFMITITSYLNICFYHQLGETKIRGLVNLGEDDELVLMLSFLYFMCVI